MSSNLTVEYPKSNEVNRLLSPYGLRQSLPWGWLMPLLHFHNVTSEPDPSLFLMYEMLGPYVMLSTLWIVNTRRAWYWGGLYWLKEWIEYGVILVSWVNFWVGLDQSSFFKINNIRGAQQQGELMHWLSRTQYEQNDWEMERGL